MTPVLRRRILFAALYFSEGAPIGFLWWALPTRLRAAGVELSDITALLAALALPWAFKFLAAPFIDILRTPRWPLRAWIASSQLLMGLCLVPALLLDWRAEFAAIAALLLLHAVAAATQDAAVDAYALAIVAPDERGAINASMQAGVLTGRALFGGGALLLDARIGPNATIALLIGAVWASLAMLLIAGEPEPARPATSFTARRREFQSALGDVLRLRSTWLVLGFAAIGGAGFESVGLLVGPYLLDRGFSQDQIGAFLFLPTVLAMMAGAVAAGWIADRVDRRRVAGGCVALIAVVILTLAMWPGAGSWVTFALLTAIYFLIGVLTTTSYALFMDLTDRRLGATQLSAAMSATNLCESWSGLTSGRVAAAMGYGPAFASMAIASLLALPLLWMMPRTRSS